MGPPNFTGTNSARLTIISDTLAQSGLLLWSHLLQRAGNYRIVYCLENDSERICLDLDGEYSVVDCWSSHDFEDTAPDTTFSPAHVRQLAASKLTGSEFALTGADVFVDSLDALVEATSETRALAFLRTLLSHGSHVTLLMHSDSIVPCSWVLTRAVCSSLLHLEVHPGTITGHLQKAYGLASDALKAPAILRNLHQRSWAGASHDHVGDSSAAEASTSLNALGHVQGNAFVAWSHRKFGGGKMERGTCMIVSNGSDLAWEEVKSSSSTTIDARVRLPDFDLERTPAQQVAKDGVRLPFAPGSGGPAVLYEADSGDDFDEDEPDDELEI